MKVVNSRYILSVAALFVLVPAVAYAESYDPILVNHSANSVACFNGQLVSVGGNNLTSAQAHYSRNGAL